MSVQPIVPLPRSPEIVEIAEGIRNTDLTADQISHLLAPTLESLVSMDDHDFARSFVPGNPADFVATTLLRSATLALRLHVHAPDAEDTSFHTHKGFVRSTVLSGVITNTTAVPLFHGSLDNEPGLSVWECGTPEGKKHVMVKTGMTATINPDTIKDKTVTSGASFVVKPADFHKIAVSPDATDPTVSLCLFELNDGETFEPHIVTSKRRPTVKNRTVTPDFAHAALTQLADNGVE